MQQSLAPRPLAAERPPWLRGSFRVPGDRIISHLAVIAAATARGESLIVGLGETLDILATVRAMRALGAHVDKRAGGWHVVGLGVGGLLEPVHDLDFAGSVVGATLTAGLLAPYDFASRFVGAGALAATDMRPLFEILARFGTETLADDDGRPPLRIKGAMEPMPIIHRFVSEAPLLRDAAVLGALAVPGTSTLIEPGTGAGHAERLLTGFGARFSHGITDHGASISIEGLPHLVAQQVVVPGDPSAAGFAMVAASLVPHSEVLIEGVLMHPARSGLMAALIAMGADIAVVATGKWGIEDVANLRVRHASLRGITAPAGVVAPDDLPALAVAAAAAQGETLLSGAAPDQLDTLLAGLRASGIVVGSDALGVRIGGSGSVPGGGHVATRGDAAIAMAFLVLGKVADNPIVIDDQGALASSFPDFVRRFEEIGASYLRYDA